MSEYNNEESLYKFSSSIENDRVLIDRDELLNYLKQNPQPFKRNEYLGQYADTHPEETEPFTNQIKELARNGLSKIGHHGFTESMGVDRNTLPQWKDIQYLPAQLWKKPLADNHGVSTETIIGPRAQKPLKLSIPIFVSDMSFGALSREAKIALAKGAEMSGTGICSGEGGMLPEEQQSNSRYFYELASARFGFSFDKIKNVQDFHFKGGQGAKTLMLGADAIAVSNSALQAIGCLGMRACHSNNCPVGIATQKKDLRNRLQIEKSAQQLYKFLSATTDLMKIVARACGYDNFKKFNNNDLTTFNRDLHYLTGIPYSGIVPCESIGT